MAGPYIQACTCKHGKAIHFIFRRDGKLRSPCNFPNCRCKEYKPGRKAKKLVTAK